MTGALPKKPLPLELPHLPPPKYQRARKGSASTDQDSIAERHVPGESTLAFDAGARKRFRPLPAKGKPIERASLDRLSKEARSALSAYSKLIAGSLQTQLLPPLFVLREAVYSCRLEGACVEIEDVLKAEAKLPAPRAHPWLKQGISKAQHCAKAIQAVMQQAAERPLNGDFAKDLYRRHFLDFADNCSNSLDFVDSWRRFSAAAPHPSGGWGEQHRHRQKESDALMRLAALYAESDISPPFLRHSGYVMRVLVPLSLHSHGLLAYPLFCLSEYFANHREEYEDSLITLARDGDGSHWCQFFLRGLRDQALRDQKRAERITELYKKKQRIALQLPRSRFNQKILDAFFCRPIFSHKMLKGDTGLHWQSLDRFYRYCFIKNIITPLHPPPLAESRRAKSPVYLVNGLMEAAFGEGDGD